MNLDWSGFVGRGAGRGRDGPFRSGWNFFISYAAAASGGAPSGALALPRAGARAFVAARAGGDA